LEFGHEANPRIIANKIKITEKLIENLWGAPVGCIHLDPLAYEFLKKNPI